ncbi:MAG TPA: DUF3592 domain-containing protein [Pirellulales bacterium]|nr:DUF3592 domain-containing protein [Pirellulales bacterium]
MSRSLVRFYGKKRGDRRTGSRKLGSVGSGCFFAICFLVGCAGLAVVLVKFIIPELRVNRDFIEQTCQVVDQRVDEIEHRDGPLFAPRIRVQFKIQEREYSPWARYDVTDVHTHDRARSETLLRQFPVGQEFRCWRDPRNPERVVLSRGNNWIAWLMLVAFPVPFLVLGGVGLFYFVQNWDKSAERRAAEQQAARRDLFDEAADARPALPFVPQDAGITDSPGTTLAYRLPSERAGWHLPALLAGSVVWNGVVAVFLSMAVQGHLAGDPDWFLTIFLVPLVLVGLGLIAALVRTWWAGTGIGPTIVEISEHPLRPGESCQVFVSQGGRLSIHSFRILLVCEEIATYRQGTNTRTAVERVFEREVFSHEHFAIHPEVPFETQLPLEMPGGAMHSFRSEHNQIHWKLVVAGETARRRDFERSFALVIHPGRAGSEAA